MIVTVVAIVVIVPVTTITVTLEVVAGAGVIEGVDLSTKSQGKENRVTIYQ